MATNAVWRGPVMFAGFPVPIAVFETVKRSRPKSFKTLDPVHKRPIKQTNLDIEGTQVPNDKTLRGVENGKDNWAVLPPEALEMIARVGKSQAVEIERFSTTESVPFDLALFTYTIVPDERVTAAESSVQTFWNGLKVTGLAAVIPNWCSHAGSKPSTLVIKATDEGLVGYLMPFPAEVVKGKGFSPQLDDRQQTMMAQAIEQYPIKAFDLEAYPDTYTEQRQAAIDMALSGEVPEPTPEPEVKQAVPDLMAALQAMKAPAKTPKAKSKPKKEVAA